VTVSAGYRATGVRTFVLARNGVVDEKDFGSQTLDELKITAALQLLQSCWTPVPEDDE
jgi:Protein of unknown function (DUF2950)